MLLTVWPFSEQSQKPTPSQKKLEKWTEYPLNHYRARKPITLKISFLKNHSQVKSLGLNMADRPETNGATRYRVCGWECSCQNWYTNIVSAYVSPHGSWILSFYIVLNKSTNLPTPYFFLFFWGRRSGRTWRIEAATDFHPE